MKFFNLSLAKTICVVIFSLKLIVYLYILSMEGMELGGEQSGNDSEYYHAYAIGTVDNAVNYWPIILRFLNEYNFYNREYVSVFLFALSMLPIPYLTSKIITNRKYSEAIPKHQKLAFWHLMIIILIYPTLFAFTLDIYRDVFMVMIFITTIYLIKKFIEKKEITSTLLLLMPILILILILYELRVYLGFAALIALFLYKLKYNGKNLYLILILYILSLLILKESGQLQGILLYRGEEGFQGGSSTLGIGLINSNILEFPYFYFYSTAMQLFGLYITSFKALFAFFLESLFFMIAFFYILKNRKFLTPFARYLIVFSAIYGTIWILGNDNLGTAVRLRIYNYISIYLIAAIIFLEKSYYIHAIKK